MRVDSREQATLAEFDSRQQRPEARGEWGDIVQGIVLSLREAGFDLDGFDLSISSDVPVGAGLSSSAAVELAVVTALDACLGLGLQSIERARVAHAAETGFVGVKCAVPGSTGSNLPTARPRSSELLWMGIKARGKRRET